jgi:hypothetical protein
MLSNAPLPILLDNQRYWYLFMALRVCERGTESEKDKEWMFPWLFLFVGALFKQAVM